MYNKNKKNTLTNNNSTKEEINIALVGPAGCGKSALLVKYITKRFIGDYDPFYEGCWARLENVDGIEINVNIKDTYDKERKDLEKHLKWSDALVLMYSVTSSQSFFIIQEYLEHVHEILKKLSDDPNEKTEKPQVKIVLLGNKIDLERYRQVNKQDVETILEKYLNTANNKTDLTSSQNSETISLNIIHMESTSCDDYELVQNLFHKIIREVKRDRDAYQLTNPLSNSEETSSITNGQAKSNSFKYRFNSSPSFLGHKPSKSPKSINNITSSTNPNITTSVNNNNSSQDQVVSTSPPNLVSFPNSSKKNKFPFFTKILNKS